MKKLCRIEFNGDEYEFVADTYVSFLKSNTIFILVDEATEKWHLLRDNAVVGGELGARIDEIVARYCSDLKLMDAVRKDNDKEWREANASPCAPLGLAACAPCDPCVPRIPWYWKIDTPYIKGILTPFTLFGTLSAGILFTEWLVRLLKSC